ncbi:MAG: signal recognition particle protein [Clostridiales Family XIII bacterium]|jgi:signal recognition particle subunit SRP54|nr:signal recognition particle protein [Clostridiales Family XIII bacterium]
MAFEGLQEKLQSIFKNLRGKGVLSEADIDGAMREIKLALLEADVNFKVVKDFIASVKEKALGTDIHAGLNPGQQVIKIVQDELVSLMGGASSKLTYSPSGFTAIMMVGLQGTGKTTTCAKLAAYLKKNGKAPMLAACDVYRPAAIDQLEIVGKSVDVPVYAERPDSEGHAPDPVAIAEHAIAEARRLGRNVLIIDTAGRLQIDEALMEELRRLKAAVKPHEILLVVDSLMGQDAVSSAEGFASGLGVDGIIMTKLDGDSRGGAALSTKSVTGKPIKFIGAGEKLDALEAFHPDRMASRILGMGDVLTLVDKLQEEYDEAKAEELERKMRKNAFTLEDFLEQMAQIKKMGGLTSLIGMLPGMGAGRISDEQMAESEKELVRMEAVMLSMTRAERNDPSVLDASRRKRIAAGSGQSVAQVNQLVKKYGEAKKMMKGMMKPGRGMRGFPGMFQ